MKLTRWLMYTIILAAVIGGVLFYSWIFKYLVTAVVFAYILNPWVSWMERHHIHRLAGIFLTYAFIAVVITWGVSRVVPLIIDQAQSLLEFVKTTSERGEVSLLRVPFIQNLLIKVDAIDKTIPFLSLHDQFIRVVNGINNSMINIPDFLVRNYPRILEAVSLIATVPIIGFFLLKDNVKFRKDFLKLIPNRYFEIAIIMLNKIDEIIGKYLRAIFYEIIIVGTLSSIVLSLLGVEYAILIGFLAGVANVIPYFGPWLGGFFAVLSILIAGNPPIMILYVGFGMYLVQVIDNNLVYPVVVGTSIEMHPLIVLLTVLAGGWSYGLIGMLVAVPVIYLVYGVIRVLYINLKEFKMI